MLPPLSAEQRTQADRYGGLIPVWDPLSRQAYLMVPVSLEPGSATGDCSANIAALGMYADGNTEEEALIALAVVTGTYLEMLDEGVED